MGVEESQNVLIPGDAVEFIECVSAEKQIYSMIENFKLSQFKTLTIIYNEESKAKHLLKNEENNYFSNTISVSNSDDKVIVVLSAENCKGLEFDSVILLNPKSFEKN